MASSHFGSSTMLFVPLDLEGFPSFRWLNFSEKGMGKGRFGPPGWLLKVEPFSRPIRRLGYSGQAKSRARWRNPERSRGICRTYTGKGFELEPFSRFISGLLPVPI